MLYCAILNFFISARVSNDVLEIENGRCLAVSYMFDFTFVCWPLHYLFDSRVATEFLKMRLKVSMKLLMF